MSRPEARCKLNKVSIWSRCVSNKRGNSNLIERCREGFENVTSRSLMQEVKSSSLIETGLTEYGMALNARDEKYTYD